MTESSWLLFQLLFLLPTMILPLLHRPPQLSPVGAFCPLLFLSLSSLPSTGAPWLRLRVLWCRTVPLFPPPQAHMGLGGVEEGGAVLVSWKIAAAAKVSVCRHSLAWSQACLPGQLSLAYPRGQLCTGALGGTPGLFWVPGAREPSVLEYGRLCSSTRSFYRWVNWGPERGKNRPRTEIQGTLILLSAHCGGEPSKICPGRTTKSERCCKCPLSQRLAWDGWWSQEKQTQMMKPQSLSSKHPLSESESDATSQEKHFETFQEKVIITQIIMMQGKGGKWFRKSLRWDLRES